MAGLFDPDPRATQSEAPDVFARVPGVAGRPDFSAMQGIAANVPAFAAPEPPQAPRPADPDIWLNEGTGQLYVQGYVFDGDDAQMALDTEELLSQPGSGEAPPSGWTPLDVGTWGMHLNSIKNPSMGRLAKKNFGRGVDVNQMLAGRFLQFAGAEETGQRIVGNQIEDLRKTGPYERMFTDIGEQENRGILDWFVANLAQQGPNIVESALTAAGGAIAGGVAGGGANPFTAAGGALMSLAGKESFKQAVLAAAKKHATGQALSAAETKLLREAAGITAAARIKAARAAARGGAPAGPSAGVQLAERRATRQILTEGPDGRPIITRAPPLAGTVTHPSRQIAARLAAEQRTTDWAAANKLATGASAGKVGTAGLNQARVGGAGLASLGQNYMTGVADVYGETVESGDEDRAAAAALGIPYALLETAPEFLLAGRVFGNLGGRNRVFGTTPLKDIPGRLGKTGEMVKRAGIGFGIGGTGEGFTEAGQESLLLGVNDDVDWDSPEGMDRLINSFAAGFGVGGPIGGVGGMFGTDSKAPANMLNPGQSPEPAAASVTITPPNAGTPRGGLPAPVPGPTPLGGELMSPVVPFGGPPGGGSSAPLTSLGTPTGTPPGTILTGEGAIPTGPGTQGVLPLFDQMPATEMAQRMGGVPALPLALPPGSGAQPVSDTFTNPQQGALQFAPPAPGPTADFGSAIAQALAAAQRGPQFEQATAQREQQTQAQRDADYERALAQRDLQSIPPQPAPIDETLANMPMVESGPRTPQQMSLFKRGQTPRPSRGELLRRGVAPLPMSPAPAAEVDLEPTGNVQLEMFTGEGAPTVAALKGAGLRRQRRPTPAGTGVPQIPPTGKKVSVQDIAKARAKAAEKAGPTRGLKKQAGVAKVEKANAVQERSAAQVDAREQTGNGEGMGGEVAPVKAAGAGAKLRRGKAVENTTEPDRKEAIVPENVTPPATKGKGLKKGKPPGPKTVAAAAPAAAAATKAAPSSKADAKEALKRDFEAAREQAELEAEARNKAEEAKQAELEAEAEARDAAEADRRARFAAKGGDAKDVLNAVEIIEEMTTRELVTREGQKQYLKALTWLLGALNETEGNFVKSGAVEFIQQFLEGVPKNSLYREALVRAAAQEETVAGMIISNKHKTSRPNPFFSAIIQAGMFKEVGRVATYRDLPPEYATPSIVPAPETLARKSKTVRGKFRLIDTPAEAEAKADEVPTPSAIAADKAALDLAAEIRKYNQMMDEPNAGTRRTRIKKLEDLWEKVVEEGTEDFLTENGQPLSAYFRDDSPKTVVVDKRLRIVTKQATKEELSESEAALRAARQAARDEADPTKVAADDYISPSTLDDWNRAGTTERERDSIDKDFDGRYFRDDGQPLSGTVPGGRVRIMVKEFLAKLTVKPKIHVYKSQADLKASNPELYARAAAARPKGDFDTTSAVGYSFGDGEIIIFTDRVATERQLKFVLAHETLGHFGFRSMMPSKELDAALRMVYDLSPRVKAVVDLAMQTRGLPKSEAIEEYLADFAGVLDSNLLARFWASIKNFLNKFGVKFDDDMARYLVSQSRAYVRNGKVDGSFVNFRQMAERWLAVETLQDPDGVGRFAQSAEFYDDTNRLAVDDLFGVRANVEMNVEEAKRWLENKGINVGDRLKKLALNLRTMNYASRENFGYRRLYEILRATVHMAASLRSKYNAMMSNSLNAAVEVAGRTVYGGTTKAQRKTANAMLRVTSRVKLKNLTDRELKKMGSLFTFVGGEARLNKDVLAALQARGRMTLDDFRNGFEYTEFKAHPKTEAEQQRLRDEYQSELDKLKAANADESELKSLKKLYDDLLEDNTYLAPVKMKFDPKQMGTENLTADSPEWVMYNEVRDTMDTAAIDLLQANFAAAQGERANVMRVVHNFLNRTLTTEDREFIQKIESKYIDLRGKNSTVSVEGFIQLDKNAVAQANEFIVAFNMAVLGKTKSRADAIKNLSEGERAVEDYFDKAEYDDISAGIERLQKGSNIPKSGNRRFAMQQAIQNLALFEMSKDDAQLLAKRSIAGGYVPFGREGTWQVRINAVDPNTGRVYKVSERYRQNLLYLQTPNKAEAQRAAEFVNGMFGNANQDGTFELEVLNSSNEYEIRKVKLVAQAETARETMSSARETNLNEVIATITRFSIDLTPGERERLVVGLTRQNHRARTRLERSGNPGEDPDTMKYVSQHLEATASTVARKHNRHHLDRLFDDADGDSERLWKGSEDEYRRLKQQWKAAEADPAATPQQKAAAKRAYEDYHYAYKIKDSQTYGNYYKDQGQRLLGFLDAQKDVEFTDFGSGDLVSSIRTWTTFAMLGLSPATAILNFISLGTNSLPSLAGHNPKNGFGGGFGWGASQAALTRAMNDVKNAKQSDLKYWDHLLEANEDGSLVDPQRIADAGFTRWEAEFMQKEVASGSMQAALTNAMLGTARGRMTSGGAQKFAKAWMGLFNYSEQMARRSTGLSAFRLAFNRAIGEGKSEADAFVIADQFAVELIENTLGEYAMFNRPALFRGGLMQFVFMYKMFPVNMIQMLAALDRKTQLAALGILLLFSGLKGLPFAEDLMDIIDTIAQALGLGPRGVWKGSAERSLAELLDAAVPGLTPLAMRGVLNHILPMNIADRTSLGNIVPGTGIGLAGADVGRELIEIGGPFASFMQGAIGSASDITKLALEPSVAGAISTVRGLPITMLRAFGDTWAYANTGAIVSQKGYIVSPDLHAGVFLTRLLGFYPSSAVTENDVVRMGKRLIDYRREVAAHYYGRFVMASLSGDNEAVLNVYDDVDVWNEAAKGTELELSNFRQSAKRALKDARRTATQRYLRTVPLNARKETQQIMDMLMTDEELAASN